MICRDLIVELEPDPDAPERAREAVDQLELPLAPGVRDDLRLIVSELVASAVEHGRATPIRVELEAHSGTFVAGSVADGGGASGPHVAAGETVGRGLPILDSLATRWGVRVGPTHVWFELRAA